MGFGFRVNGINVDVTGIINGVKTIKSMSDEIKNRQNEENANAYETVVEQQNYNAQSMPQYNNQNVINPANGVVQNSCNYAVPTPAENYSSVNQNAQQVNYQQTNNNGYVVDNYGYATNQPNNYGVVNQNNTVNSNAMPSAPYETFVPNMASNQNSFNTINQGNVTSSNQWFSVDEPVENNSVQTIQQVSAFNMKPTETINDYKEE